MVQVGEVRSDCRWPSTPTEKIKHFPIDNGKLLKFFKQRNDLFKIMFLRFSLVPLQRY